MTSLNVVVGKVTGSATKIGKRINDLMTDCHIAYYHSIYVDIYPACFGLIKAFAVKPYSDIIITT